MKTLLLSRAATAAFGVAMLCAPHTTWAATYQQLIDTGIGQLTASPALKYTGTADITINQRAVQKSYAPTNGVIGLSFWQRVLAPNKANQNSEGGFSLQKFNFTGKSADNTNPLQTIALTQPLNLEWKSIDATTYLFINNIPASILTPITNLGIDLTPFLNRWISLERTDTTSMASERLGVDASELSGLLKLTSMKQPLRVLSVEKRSKNAKNETILRLRVRINPSLINQLQKEEINALDAKATDRKTRIAEINKQYAELRKSLARLSMVAQLNQATGALERLEIGGQQSEPKKECVWNSTTNRDVCRTTHIQTTKTQIGVNIAKDSGEPVIAPASATSFVDIVKEIQEKMDAAASSTESGTGTTLPAESATSTQ